MCFYSTFKTTFVDQSALENIKRHRAADKVIYSKLIRGKVKSLER